MVGMPVYAETKKTCLEINPFSEPTLAREWKGTRKQT